MHEFHCVHVCACLPALTDQAAGFHPTWLSQCGVNISFPSNPSDAILLWTGSQEPGTDPSDTLWRVELVCVLLAIADMFKKQRKFRIMNMIKQQEASRCYISNHGGLLPQ